MNPEERIVLLKKERDEARDWVRRLTNENGVLTCAYCGQEYPPGTPAANDSALTAHIRVCLKHPIREVEKKLARLVEAAELVLDTEPCHFDHHGNCQAHGISNPCEQKLLKEAIKAAKER